MELETFETQTEGTELTELGDDELLARVKTLCGKERELLARIVAYLAEVEERRIHLKLSFASMFEFCQRHLNMSEGQAFRRIAAARLVRRFPPLLVQLERGDLHLSALILLRDHLTDDNYDDLIAAVSRKSKRRVEELIAARFPRPDVPSKIRKSPDAFVPLVLAASTLPHATAADASTEARHLPNVRANTHSKARIEPLSEARFKVQLTVSKELRDKLERAVQLMRHRNPSGDLTVAIDRALDLLLAKLETERLGKTSRPQKTTRAAKTGHVSRSARRKVFERDDEQCSYVGENGERCLSRTFLEIDHVHPRALGGAGAIENIRLLCRAHNRLRAEEAFGREHVARQIDLHRRKSPATSAAGAAMEPTRDVDVAAAPHASKASSLVSSALVNLGFRQRDALRAVDMVVSRPDSPASAEGILRNALAVLT